MLTKTSTIFFAFLIIMLATKVLCGATGSIEGKITDLSTG